MFIILQPDVEIEPNKQLDLFPDPDDENGRIRKLSYHSSILFL